ncbi:MAG: AmmeMemoRadiSam system protein B [Gammaproteobacteria bacterium]
MSLTATVSVRAGPRVKAPSVAGTFYPADALTLRSEVDGYLAAANAEIDLPPGHRIQAVVVPHAGYRYSGAVAASAYAPLAAQIAGAGAQPIRRVVLYGPAHRTLFTGFAAHTTDQFKTPLGDIPVDKKGLEVALSLPDVDVYDEAFQGEHSLEVHLPFLQAVLGEFAVIPLLAGRLEIDEAAQVIDHLWGGPETLVVVSSDLSHYLTYDEACQRDRTTSNAIQALRPDAIQFADACGRNPLRGLLKVARQRRMRATIVDQRNSGDTAGNKDRVVGYGSYLLSEAALGTETIGMVTALSAEVEDASGNRLGPENRRALADAARASITHGLTRGTPLALDVNHYDPALREKRSSFVTVKVNDKLRGCIGSVHPTRPLVHDVAHNAYGAAFKDPRFEPLTQEEAEQMELTLAVLTTPQLMRCANESELLAALRPGVDGLLLQDKDKRATYLPSVWKTLGEPAIFVQQLKRKAGLPTDHWSDTLRVSRYTVESFPG